MGNAANRMKSLLMDDSPQFILIIGFATLFTFAIVIIGLLNGITTLLPHLFYIPIVFAAYRYPREGIIPSRCQSCGRSPKTNRLDSFTSMPIVIPATITWGQSFITAHRFGEPLRKA